MSHEWVDIHCHLVPGIDDGATDEGEALAMARLAVEHGTATVICTPHQLGAFRQNRGSELRRRVNALQELLNVHQIPLVVLPGGDVRIEDDLPQLLDRDEVLTLGDHRKHVLLELPHELYFPLEPVLQYLAQRGMAGILSHPERNRGILRQPQLVESLVDAGCLMQVTCGSLMGSFGPESQQMSEWMVERGLLHFLASDGHGSRSRRPLMSEAARRAAELAGERASMAWCRDFPRQVAEGKEVPKGRVQIERPRSRGWMFWKKAS